MRCLSWAACRPWQLPLLDACFENVSVLLPSGAVEGVKAQDICVGHVIRVSTDQRVPADLVMLRTHDPSGTAFVRTDQARKRTRTKPRAHEQA